MSRSNIFYGSVALAALVTIVIALMTFGINDNGYRTVVQRPSGYTFVKFEPGIYFDWFGKSTVYPNVITYNFTGKGEDFPGGLVDGVDVRYQDGGEGSIHGVARFTLSSDEKEMLELHRAFRSEMGVRSRLIQPVMNEAMNLTAGLMTSEEAYAEKRNEFIEWSEDQVKQGKYLTKLVKRTQIVEPAELDKDGKIVKEEVTRVQNIPVIRLGDDGRPLRGDSPLRHYYITVSGFQVEDWNFEKATLDQIQEKRKANMAIITSQANAARANQERLQAIAEGERNVAQAKYEQEVEKERQVVIAQREKEVAVIGAEKMVDVNHQNYLAQVEDVKAAEQEAIAIDLRSRAEAAARKRIIEADGALAQKLATYEKVMTIAFQEFSKQKWTPEIVMGEGGATGSSADTMINLLTTKAAKDLSLDLSVQGQK